MPNTIPRPLFDVNWPGKPGKQEPLTLLWTGSAHFTYFRQAFDSLRTARCRQLNVSWTLSSLRALTPDTPQVPAAFFQESKFQHVLEPTDLEPPLSSDFARFDASGIASRPNIAPESHNVGIDLSIWGNVFSGPRSPNKPTDQVGVFCDLNLLTDAMLVQSIASFMQTTQYGTVRDDVYAEAVAFVVQTYS